MHDVHRDSLIAKGKKRKVKKTDHAHSHDEHADSHGDDHGHAHDEKDHDVQGHSGHSHDHDAPHHDHEDDHDDAHGHEHDHDEDAYEEHDHDLHTHGHERTHSEDRAFAHIHEHGHDFFHAHHHSHHPEHAGIVHKVFGDPVKDWFGAFLMGILIIAGYLRWVPGPLSDGMLVCAAVIGIFPLLKKALFDCVYNRKFRFELLVGIVLVAGIFLGKFLEVALIVLLLLMGSFMRLNFSWKD
jgi:cation transport ATPase